MILLRFSRYSTISCSSGMANGPLRMQAASSGLLSLAVTVNIVCINPFSESSDNANSSFCWFLHQAVLSGIDAGIAVPYMRVRLSVACGSEAFLAPLLRLFQFKKNNSFVMMRFKYQKAYKLFSLKMLCIRSNRFFTIRCAPPEPTSAKRLPVPYGCLSLFSLHPPQKKKTSENWCITK